MLEKMSEQNIAEMNERAKQALEKEKYLLPFSFDTLNQAYLIMRDQYSATGDASSIQIPDDLAARVNIDAPKEMGLAEACLHSLVSTFITRFWYGSPVEIGMTATGRCPLHPEDEQVFTHTLKDEKVGQITKPDVVLTAETIGNCAIHPDIKLYGDMSHLEYKLIGPDGNLYTSDEDIPSPVVGFQSRIKTTSQLHKLTRAIVGDKNYALDFRGARLICKNLDSYIEAGTYLLNRIRQNHDIRIIPLNSSLEEYIGRDKDLSKTLYSAHPDSGIITKNDNNDYKSFHALIRYRGHPIELQCRDLDMHETAENGLAAHRKYKEEELARLKSQYPDYDQVYDRVSEIYRGLVPSELRLSQAPFSPLAHN